MGHGRKLILICAGAALAGATCATGTSGVDDGEGGAGGDYTSGSPSSGPGPSTGAMTGSTSAGSGTTSTTSAGSSGSATTGSGATSGSTGAGTSSSSGGGGMACIPSGALSAMGTAGPCNANQNCPVTSFTAVVSGAPGPIVDVDVSIDAIAATVSENVLSLRSPQGTVVTLFNKHGTFLTDDFLTTMFDDEAAQSVATAPGPFHDCYRPDQPLSAFQG